MNVEKTIGDLHYGQIGKSIKERGNKNMSEERKRLEQQLEYMPLFVMYNGRMVRVTIENYEEVTGRKLPK